MTLAEHVAFWLEEKGVRHGFGIIGGGNVALWGAISALGYTELICCHHEQAAAMAASYYARMKGTIGFCLVTTGAGSSNAITGVLAAYMDGVPLLVISGNEASKYFTHPMRIHGVQGYDSSWVADGFTKFSMQADKNVDLDDAYSLAIKARQGPVWVDIPKDLQSAVLH